MKVNVMRQWCIFILACLTVITAFLPTDAFAVEFTAKLPNGISIELIGLRNYSIRDLEKFKDRNFPWWKPDGTVLSEPPDIGWGRTSSEGSYWFVIRATGDKDCDFKAVGPYNVDRIVQPVRQKAHGLEQDDLRYFALRFSPSQTMGDIKLGVACGDWQIADRWSIEPNWTPYNLFIGSSDQLVLRCPEQVGSDVVAEVTQIMTERVTRLVLFDQDGNQYESRGNIGGDGIGLIRYVHRFKNLDRKKVEHLEFQARPYDYWITFSNVSLKIGHKTQVKTDLKQPGVLLKGNSLPSLDGIGLDFPSEDIEKKMLLICFFDMNQRPSRRCIIELAKEAGQLKQKGVYIIAIQATKIDHQMLDDWAQKNNTLYPIRIIEKEVEKTRFTWGVKSLPWLILTDKQHLVIDTGFGLSELDGKIEAAN
jgi:hypothetical protein